MSEVERADKKARRHPIPPSIRKAHLNKCRTSFDYGVYIPPSRPALLHAENSVETKRTSKGQKAREGSKEPSTFFFDYARASI